MLGRVDRILKWLVRKRALLITIVVIVDTPAIIVQFNVDTAIKIEKSIQMTYKETAYMSALISTYYMAYWGAVGIIKRILLLFQYGLCVCDQVI